MDLYNGKDKLIAKYGLKLNDDGYWFNEKENAHLQIYFKNTFFQNNDLIIILFRIYKLCFGKVSYFRRNHHKYEAYKYHYKDGFVKTELWDAEFFKHIRSDLFIDLRQLQTITDIQVFLQLVAELEMYEEEENRDNSIFERLKL